MRFPKYKKLEENYANLQNKHKKHLDKSTETENEYKKLKKTHLKLKVENQELKEKLNQINKNIQQINKGRSYRFTKINIELSNEETFFTLKSLLENLKIDANDFSTVLNKLANRGVKKPITVLTEIENKSFIKWVYLLFHFGLQAKQIAYLTGNVISPSVLSRYLKEEYGDNIKQKPIATYNMPPNHNNQMAIIGKQQFNSKIPIEDLLSQEMFCCVFDKTNRLELSKAMKIEKVVSRKK